MNAASSAQWPNNVVPYVLDAAFTSADRAIIAAVSILKYQAHKIRKRGVAICFDLLVSTHCKSGSHKNGIRKSSRKT
jgi:hypothetical protein